MTSGMYVSRTFGTFYIVCVCVCVCDDDAVECFTDIWGRGTLSQERTKVLAYMVSPLRELATKQRTWRQMNVAALVGSLP